MHIFRECAKTIGIMDAKKIVHIQKKLTGPVVLIGLMGAGKTRMGMILSGALSMAFTDADDVIVDRAGMSISDIFEKCGEPHFRALEAAVMDDLLSRGTGVISPGGGAVMTPATADKIFSENVVSVWLDAPIDVLAERVSRNKNRPLVAGGDLKTKLTQLMKVRGPVYGRATLRVDNGARTLDDTLEDILSALYTHLTP